MITNKYKYVILIVALFLLVVKLISTDFSNFYWKQSFGIISPILLILAMVISIKHTNKLKENNSNTND
jgi:hypothetical protein